MTDNCKPIKAGFQRIELNKTVWEIPTKYTDLNLIGAGAYGQVCAAKNKENGENVAVKKLSRPFQSDIHAKRTYREVRMLKHMDHDNIISLLDIFTPTESIEKFSDLYLVSELMGPDLAKVLRRHTLPPYQIQLYVYQILRALKYIHSAGIIHRDLKPGNVAAHDNGELKVLDFGLARYHGHSGEEMTGYVATRWYRAPEIILSWMHYNHTADVWSVGCIMAEMFTGRVLFPGANTIDQLKKIMDILGTPDKSLLAKLTSDDARTFIESLPKTKKKPFEQVDSGFQRATPEAIDLLERMLDLDPDTRITAEQALAHEYLAKYSDPSDEPTSEIYDQSFENEDLKDEEWKKLVYDEVNSFQPRPVQDMELE